MRIAHGNEPIFRHQRERKRTLHVRNRLDDRLVGRHRARSRVQVQNHFGIGGRLEDRPMPAELVFELAGVHEVAVVRDGDLPVRALNQNRLRVVDFAVSGGRIAHVSDGDGARQLFERLLGERVGDMAHRLRDAHLRAVRCGNAGALLAAMLKRVEPEVGQVGGFGMAEDAEHAAFFLEFVVGPHAHVCASRPCGRVGFGCSDFLLGRHMVLGYFFLRPMQLAA